MKLLLGHLKQTDRSWLVDMKKSEDGLTALHLASLNNFTEMAKLILDFGSVDANARCSSNQTALHFAVARLNVFTIRNILEYGRTCSKAVNPNIQDNDGHTPLHCLMLAYTILNLRAAKMDGKSKNVGSLTFQVYIYD